jgi:uncharacterized membrane protein YuzA (DUF378 family)
MVKSDEAMSHLSDVYFILDFCHYYDIDFVYKLDPRCVVSQLYLVWTTAMKTSLALVILAALSLNVSYVQLILYGVVKNWCINFQPPSRLIFVLTLFCALENIIDHLAPEYRAQCTLQKTGI